MRHPTFKVLFPGFFLPFSCSLGALVLLITDLLIISWSLGIGEGLSGCEGLYYASTNYVEG
jgi:hypothetical protein